MEVNGETNLNGIPRWSGPWVAGWTSMQRQVHTLPKNARQRIQRVGIAATSVAAMIWLLGIGWALQLMA